MDRQQQFYGTPLIRSLKNANELDNNEASSSYKNRKARLDYQQTVRDSEGRQRFHGAFTGGFSAGFHNSVDTKEGFRPKEFVSHRSSRHGGVNKVEHCPEDYMDDEDLGEFGIAPRKIRVNNIYSDKESSSSSRNVLLKALQPKSQSIGDKILAATSISALRRATSSETVSIPAPPVKNNYHGLGYQPLRRNERSDQTSSHPLMAMLGQGKRLKISGEAFGSGVLEDDDDDLLYDGGMNGVYDDMRNYDFSQVATKSSGARSQTMKNRSDDVDDDFMRDPYALPGFVLAKDLSALNINDTPPKYPPPRISSNWKMPTRSEPYVPPVRENPEQKLFLQKLKTGIPLGDKFTSATKPHKSVDIDTKQGLVHYSDIKSTKKASELVPSEEQSSQEPAFISRRVLEWRPCSLLCKRFNLPNPFPDNQFVGVRPSDLVAKDSENPQSDSAKKINAESYHIASIDLRRSIFNVIFDDVISTASSNVAKQSPIQSCQTSESEDGEDAPQVVVLSGDSNSSIEGNEQSLRDMTPEPEVIVIPKPRVEPEVIVIDSSSSSSSSPSCSDRPNRQNSTQKVDEDPYAYGPPLPPSIKTLINSNQGRSSSHKSKKSKKEKKKKHKKHK